MSACLDFAFGNRAVAVRRAQLGRQPHVEDLRRVLAHDGDRETSAVFGGVIVRVARIDGADGLGHQAQHGRPIPVRKRPGGRIEFTNRGKRGRSAVHDNRKLGRIGDELTFLAVAVDAPRRVGMQPQLFNERQNVFDGTAG